VTEEVKNYFPDVFSYLKLPCLDSDAANIAQHFGKDLLVPVFLFSLIDRAASVQTKHIPSSITLEAKATWF
jgi:hypothetical protein